MRTCLRVILLSSYVALVYGGTLTSTGCETTNKAHVDSSKVALEIRFQDDTAPMPAPSTCLPRIGSLPVGPIAHATGPTTHDTVARILVDVTLADTGQSLYTSFELTRFAPDVWRGDVPVLPRNQQLRLAARALDAGGDLTFSGETVATLPVSDRDVQIPLAPAQDSRTFQIPRILRIAHPGDPSPGQEGQVAVTIEGNVGAAIALQITPIGRATPGAEFSPALGLVTLTDTVANFVTVYTAPEVTVNTDVGYEVTVTDLLTAVTITNSFAIHVSPHPPSGRTTSSIPLSVSSNPVILGLTTYDSERPGTVELFAAVSDDSAPDKLTHQWSYAPTPGTPDAIFANSGQGNPGLFQGYTAAHEGTLTLAVTDEHSGTTTLRYPIVRDEIADPFALPVRTDGVKRIVSGDGHTCVLTNQSRVRCWGDNRFGQLGHGNTTDVGDAPTRLPYIASDVPLPSSDPVQQLVAGHNHTCALLSSGLIYCWGDNQFGQLGYGHTRNLGDDEPVTSFGYVTLGDLATRIAAGGDHTCAILQTGALRCWGRNHFGQLGRGNTNHIGDDEPVYSAGDVNLGAGVTASDLALGGFHTCALLITGAVRCWGRNDFGQLGYGHMSDIADNEPIDHLPDVSLVGAVRKLVAGDLHTCALTFDGTLQCWGDGRSGQLGQSFAGGDAFWGNAAGELPGALPGIHTDMPVTDVTAGGKHTCAVSGDGRLRCWGRGDSGQLGYGDFANQFTPPAAGVDLAGITTCSISGGAAHTCALRSNGTVRCWGQGADGRLGRGDTATSATAAGDVDVQIFAP